jgi:uncharacterized membrane-anchored protein YitT (DUF2179 family)
MEILQITFSITIYIRVLVISILPLFTILELFRQCGIFCFSFYYPNVKKICLCVLWIIIFSKIFKIIFTKITKKKTKYTKKQQQQQQQQIKNKNKQTKKT